MISKKVHRSPIPIRWVVNFIGHMGHICLIKGLYLEESGDAKYRHYFKIFSFTNFFTDHWGTYYLIDISSWSKEMEEDV